VGEEQLVRQSDVGLLVEHRVLRYLVISALDNEAAGSSEIP
jgi:hypothetical protein